MEIASQLIVSGIALGMIYAIIAFGYQLTFATSSTINFSQGDAVMIGALTGLTLSGKMNFWFLIPLVLITGAIQGIVVERITIRSATKKNSEFSWIMGTIALGIIFKNLAENVWGKEDYKFPSPLPETPLSYGNIKILPAEIFVIIGALVMMFSIELFNRKSIYGKAVVATSTDREAAGLMGINTKLVITLSYALSSMTAAFAGIMIAPLTLAGAHMGTSLGLKAFAVAIVGGLNSGMGVVVCGIALGVIEALTGFYLSTGYKEIPGLILLLLVLALKPAGLFGKTAIKKV